MIAGLLWLASIGHTPATAEEIMARVAANQDFSASARADYVYHQNVLVRMKRANGKLAREEIRDYTVTPQANGVKRELVHLAGKVGHGKQEVGYDKADFRTGALDVDGEMVQSFADDFGDERHSKDGIDKDLFPLRTEKQKGFHFTLTGAEKWHDRDVYRITYKPVRASWDDENNCWSGEALIDKTELQPLMVTSHFECRIPAAVKIILGTNVQQIGFKVTYQKFEDGVWFPVTYGGEFKFRAVFLYARTVGIGLVNSDFRRTKVDTAINYEMPEQ